NAAYQKLRGRHSRRHEVSLDEVLPVFDERGGHDAPMVDWSPTTNDLAMQSELRTALTSAIDALPATYRAVLMLRDIEGRSNAEIAETLGLSIPLVKTRAHRARLFLRKRLDEWMTTVDAPTAAYASWLQIWVRVLEEVANVLLSPRVGDDAVPLSC